MNLAYQVNCILVIDNVTESEAAFVYTALSNCIDRHKLDEVGECSGALERLMNAVFRTITEPGDELLIDRFDLPYLRVALQCCKDGSDNPFIVAYADNLLSRLGGFGATETELYHELSSASCR